jgi:hypothetical protein
VGELHGTRMHKGSLCGPTRQNGLGPAPLGHQFATAHNIIPSEGMASNTTYLLAYLQGRDTHQAVSDRLVTDKASVRSQVSPRGIYERQVAL